MTKAKYTYKQLKDGDTSVYKDGAWQCFCSSIEKAKAIFEPSE